MDTFISEVEAFLSRTGMKPSRFGREFASDPGFVPRLRSGGECLPRTMERIETAMRSWEEKNAA